MKSRRLDAESILNDLPTRRRPKPRVKRVPARFKVGDRVEALISLRSTGIPVGQGEQGNVVLVSGDRMLVNWGGNTLTGEPDVVGWVSQEFLL
jgi:hypothetical protein